MDDINLIKSAAERLLEYGESDTGGKLSEEEILTLIEQTDKSIEEYDITGKFSFSFRFGLATILPPESDDL